MSRTDDDEADARRAQAERLREDIGELVGPRPPDEREDDEPGESPREFVHRRMRDEEKPDASGDD